MGQGLGMQFKKSHKIAVVIAVAVVAYFGIRALLPDAKQDAKPTSESKSQADQIPSVVVADLIAQDHLAGVALRGSTEPVRAVVVRAQTGGRVANLPVAKGAVVRAGQVLCGLAVDARQAALDQARANLRARELEYAGAQELEAKGFRSTNATLSAKAARDAALAGVRAAEVEMAHTAITAPYGGVFDNRAVELGDVLAPGQACGTVVDLNPILVVASATETEAGSLKRGATGQARLVSGQVIHGRVRFVARNPDANTKTYQVELEVPNGDFSIPAGVAAQMRVGGAAVKAHRISPAIMALSADGKVGVRILDTNSIVRFAPITMIEETPEGVWVTGLPERVRVITVGQDFVAEGKPAKPHTAAQKGAAQ